MKEKQVLAVNKILKNTMRLDEIIKKYRKLGILVVEHNFVNLQSRFTTNDTVLYIADLPEKEKVYVLLYMFYYVNKNETKTLSTKDTLYGAGNILTKAIYQHNNKSIPKKFKFKHKEGR